MRGIGFDEGMCVRWAEPPAFRISGKFDQVRRDLPRLQTDLVFEPFDGLVVGHRRVSGRLAGLKGADCVRTVGPMVDAFAGVVVKAIILPAAFIEGKPVDFPAFALALGSLERSVRKLDNSYENSRSSHIDSLDDSGSLRYRQRRI